MRVLVFRAERYSAPTTSMSGFPQLPPNQPDPRPAPRHLSFLGVAANQPPWDFLWDFGAPFFMEAGSFHQKRMGNSEFSKKKKNIWCFSGNFLKQLFFSQGAFVFVSPRKPACRSWVSLLPSSENCCNFPITEQEYHLQPVSADFPSCTHFCVEDGTCDAINHPHYNTVQT